MRLKAALFPYDSVQIEDGLHVLVDSGLITRYEADGVKVIAIPTWMKHQRPSIRELPGVLPPSTAQAVPEHDLGMREGEGKGTGKERERNGTAALRASFDVFWNEYPRKDGKEPARKEWLRRSPSAGLMPTIFAKLRADKASPQWRKDDGQFIPHARTWLHRERWKDDDMPANSAAETGDEFLERLGYCPHKPTCETPGGAVCRAKFKAGAA